MDPREELVALRRMAELEAKAGSAKPAQQDFSFQPERDMSYPQRVTAAAGSGLSSMIRAVGGGGLLEKMGLPGTKEEADKLDAPLNASSGSTTGRIIGQAVPIAAASILAPWAAASPAGAAIFGGATGAITTEGDLADRAKGAAYGATGGALGAGIAGRLGATAGNGASPLTQGQQNALAGGDRLGMRATPGVVSGSKPLQMMEAAAESNPITSRGFNALKEGNQRLLNRAAARSIGENADELSTPVLAAAQHRLGQVFDSVADATPVALNPQTVAPRLQQILADSDGLIGGNASLADNALWQRLDNFANNAGGATREQLRTLSSKLGKSARNNMTTPQGDRELGNALFAAQNVVEDAIEGSLNGAQRAAYGEARGQYRNLLNLTTRNNVTNPSSGDVSGRALANALMSKDRGGYTMGGNASDLYDAARFYQAFPSIVGNSGTATRSMGPADYLAGIPGSLAARAYLSAPMMGAARGASGGANAIGRAIAGPAQAAGLPGVSVPAALSLQELLQQ